jgi:unsaturated rhamnogalacturonyl hydrolase
MHTMPRKTLVLALLLWGTLHSTLAQEPASPLLHWGDSLMQYAMTRYLPAQRYRWDWGEATLLKSVIQRSQLGKDRAAMDDYIATAMHAVLDRAHGKHPNAVASAVGIAYLLSRDASRHAALAPVARRILDEYSRIPRAFNGGVSHRDNVLELWDDTVYMVSLFLLEMYKSTGDDTHLTELVRQIDAHAEVLRDADDAFFYHGWDADSISTDDNCCMIGWADNPLRRNQEYWGRGNGWIAAAMADFLATAPANFPGRERILEMYRAMMHALLPLQDKVTGHWYQLPLYPGDAGNFIESSCTAMFGYAMTVGIKADLLPLPTFLPAVSRAFEGLAACSIIHVDGAYTLSNVCSGTCIGDKPYYYKRRVTRGTTFGLGMAIMFYDQYTTL